MEAYKGEGINMLVIYVKAEIGSLPLDLIKATVTSYDNRNNGKDKWKRG